MSKGVIGQPFTFTVLFTDSSGVATDVTGPTIEVFTYNSNGQKVELVAPGTTLPKSVPLEPGRYAYLYCLPTTLTADQQVYAIMQGVEPSSTINIVVEQQVDLFNAGGTAGTGIRASFVPGGGGV